MPDADELIEWPAGSGGQRALAISTGEVPPAWRPVLSPLEQLYGGVMALRNFAYDRGLLPQQHVSVPVISIGNIVAGGAGKTPLTRWITEQLLARARRPAILHGGYGSDEPKLHQRWHPEILVIAGKDRVHSARQAIEQGADVIVLDDAFQHRRLRRDLDIVLVAAETTNLHLLPRGPGREPWRALGRSHFVLITRKQAAPETALVLETRVHQTAPGIRTGRVHLKLATPLPDASVVAVSSIARPDLFLAQLQSAGARVQRLLAYPDHHEYTANDARYIAQHAAGRLLLTTAKDAVKLRELLADTPLQVVEQDVVFESGAGELMAALDNIL